MRFFRASCADLVLTGRMFLHKLRFSLCKKPETRDPQATRLCAKSCDRAFFAQSRVSERQSPARPMYGMSDFPTGAGVADDLSEEGSPRLGRLATPTAGAQPLAALAAATATPAGLPADPKYASAASIVPGCNKKSVLDFSSGRRSARDQWPSPQPRAILPRE